MSTTTSPINASLERVWRAIRAQHPDVPDAVIVLGTAAYTERGGSYVGHWAPARWDLAGERRPEVLLAGELLSDLREVLHTLLHEAAHGLAHARGIKDTSREGRYHNRRYRKLAEELGLEVLEDVTIGHTTRITRALCERYAAQLGDLETAHAAAGRARRVRPGRRIRSTGGDAGERQGDEDERQGEGGEGGEGGERGEGEGKRNPPQITIECGCGRKLRIAFHGLDAGEVLCGRCGEAFVRNST